MTEIHRHRKWVSGYQKKREKGNKSKGDQIFGDSRNEEYNNENEEYIKGTNSRLDEVKD